MASISTIVNTPVLIDLPSDYSDSGWRISGGIATHSSCNAGIMIFNNQLPDGDYNVTYEVIDYKSGYVFAFTNNSTGLSKTDNGVYTEQLTVSGDKIRFYSDGALSLRRLTIEPVNQEENSLTIAFNEKLNKWVTYYSYVPEVMIKFINGFYTAKNGNIWEHNVNELRNNFYGEQYSSEITFFVNINPTTSKQYWSLRLKSNKAWEVTEASIRPTEGKSDGMRSRIKKGNFRNLQGDWFADFLRNMDDPRFTNELDALMRGAQLQGNVLKVTIKNDDSVEVRLLSVDVSVSIKNYTY